MLGSVYRSGMRYLTESSQAAWEAGTVINQAQRLDSLPRVTHSKQGRDLNLGVLGSKAHVLCIAWPTSGRVPIRNTEQPCFPK